MTPAQTAALAALDAAMAMPIPRPDAAWSHISAEWERTKAVRRAKAAWYVACEATTKAPK